jgi:Glu-tRNA(Gln) amidotransferase subunit E-like FAD-binding protein
MTEKQQALNDFNTVLTDQQYFQLTHPEQKLFILVPIKDIYQRETGNEYYKKDRVDNLLQELKQIKIKEEICQDALKNLMSTNNSMSEDSYEQMILIEKCQTELEDITLKVMEYEWEFVNLKKQNEYYNF